ncbi:MAG TPA: OmpH family outer membrane protein [Verrucomicrobiota bacterium]|nr:OmpH family outer membrane protein [Verrucomicrobiota bacterium]
MKTIGMKMTSLTGTLLLGIAAFGLAVSAQAQPKIAVVNLKTVFDGYWKTKQSDATVKERQAEFEKERKKMVDDYQKANEEYRKLAESASDPAVAADERDKRKKTADSKLLEIKEIEQNVGQFDRQFRTQITDQIKRMRENIMREIRELVNTKAKAASYTLVLDTAAESVNQTPIVLFSSGVPDLTEEVLTELNAKAPPGSLTTEKPADAKPEEEKK